MSPHLHQQQARGQVDSSFSPIQAPRSLGATQKAPSTLLLPGDVKKVDFLSSSSQQVGCRSRSPSRPTSPCHRLRPAADGPNHRMHSHTQHEQDWVSPGGQGQTFTEGEAFLVPPPLPMKTPGGVQIGVPRPASVLGKPIGHTMPSVASPQAVASVPSPIPTPVFVQNYPPSRSVSPQTRHRMTMAEPPRPISCWKHTSPAAFQMNAGYHTAALQAQSDQSSPSLEARRGRERKGRGDSIFLKASDVRSRLPSPDPMNRRSPPRRGGRFIDMASQELSPEGKI